jgi:ATP-dependent DNA helicase 2 subunit 2
MNRGDGFLLLNHRVTVLAMSALVVGLDVLMKYCKKLKYIKNLILITDGHGAVDWLETDEIARQIKAENINLSIL